MRDTARGLLKNVSCESLHLLLTLGGCLKGLAERGRLVLALHLLVDLLDKLVPWGEFAGSALAAF